MFTVFLSGGSGATNTLGNLTTMATELLTWVITSMGSILTFIRQNPEIMVWFIVAIVGFVVGFLMRIWRSVG